MYVSCLQQSSTCDWCTHLLIPESKLIYTASSFCHWPLTFQEKQHNEIIVLALAWVASGFRQERMWKWTENSSLYSLDRLTEEPLPSTHGWQYNVKQMWKRQGWRGVCLKFHLSGLSFYNELMQCNTWSCNKSLLMKVIMFSFHCTEALLQLQGEHFSRCRL